MTSPPAEGRLLKVAGAAGGESEGVYDDLAVVVVKGDQFVVHVLLSADGPVPAGQTPVITPTAWHALGDLHHLGQVRPVVRLVDDPPHLAPGVPLVSRCGQLGHGLADPLPTLLAVAGCLAGEEGDPHHRGVEHPGEDRRLEDLSDHVTGVLLSILLSETRVMTGC